MGKSNLPKDWSYRKFVGTTTKRCYSLFWREMPSRSQLLKSKRHENTALFVFMVNSILDDWRQAPHVRCFRCFTILNHFFFIGSTIGNWPMDKFNFFFINTKRILRCRRVIGGTFCHVYAQFFKGKQCALNLAWTPKINSQSILKMKNDILMGVKKNEWKWIKQRLCSLKGNFGVCLKIFRAGQRIIGKSLQLWKQHYVKNFLPIKYLGICSKFHRNRKELNM